MLWRPAPASNMVHAWSAKEDTPFLDLPPLSGDNVKMVGKLEAWNRTLAENGSADLKVTAGGEYTIVFGGKLKAL